MRMRVDSSFRPRAAPSALMSSLTTCSSSRPTSHLIPIRTPPRDMCRTRRRHGSPVQFMRGGRKAVGRRRREGVDVYSARYFRARLPRPASTMLGSVARRAWRRGMMCSSFPIRVALRARGAHARETWGDYRAHALRLGCTMDFRPSPMRTTCASSRRYPRRAS
ncbi:hypothetical protein B0H13DRAFT_653629 [Mycena leptocephala]|nr:hypothetical protein B0H13DRAFT_653629 [Mycena leptocephala]